MNNKQTISFESLSDVHCDVVQIIKEAGLQCQLATPTRSCWGVNGENVLSVEQHDFSVVAKFYPSAIDWIINYVSCDFVCPEFVFCHCGDFDFFRQQLSDSFPPPDDEDDY